MQGGPGASSTGFGNFEEFGPLDVNLNYRETTWNRAANLLFVDNPVGAGFSSVDSLDLIPTNNTQIAADLVTLLAAFFDKYVSLQSTPFFAFCESYGGKMVTGLATALLAAIESGRIKTNFRGIALGDSWISPISFVDAWGPFLQATSLMDDNDAAQLAPVVQQCDQAVAQGQWAQATNIWGNVENVVEQVTNGVDFYNILQSDGTANSDSIYGRMRMTPLARRTMSPEALALAPEGVDHATLQSLYRRHVASHYGDPLDDLMNGPIRKKLGIIPANVTWGGQSDAVFSALSGDFMRPLVSEVDALLQGGKINVTIYEGSVDLICCATGAETWMKQLTWSGMPSFYKTTKVPQYPNATASTGGFLKEYQQLHYWTVLVAGHMVPADQGPMALAMLQYILAQQS